MSFQPRMLASGRPCCSQEYALCDSCKSFRAAAASTDPPDPYAPGLAKMRGETPPPKPPAPSTVDAPANPYTAGLEQLRKEIR